jgi:hypothetical protein
VDVVEKEVKEEKEEDEEEEEEVEVVVVHKSATKSGVVNNVPKWLRRLRHTRSKQS